MNFTFNEPVTYLIPLQSFNNLRWDIAGPQESLQVILHDLEWQKENYVIFGLNILFDLNKRFDCVLQFPQQESLSNTHHGQTNYNGFISVITENKHNNIIS